MNFTIIGAGNMGRGIATRMLNGGNSVVIMDRDNREAQKLAEELRPAAKSGATVTAASIGSPISSEFVIMAVYYPNQLSIFEQYGDQLAGKIIVDISNPLNPNLDDMGTPPGTSAAEEITKAAPAGAKVLKAFNTTFARTLLAGQVASHPLDVFIAGDDAQAKAQLAKAASAVGPLRRGRQLEGMGMLQITLQQTLGTNWGSTIKLLP